MSDLPRRDFMAAAAFAAATTAGLAGAKRAEAGDPTFMNNVPDPLLGGEELPTFKYELEKSTGKVIGNSSGKEATVLQLPISKGIAGVSMRLEPGAMRELHWHATAAEWAFVIEGRVRTTVIDPHGGAETNDFDPGDVWYFPAATATCSNAWAMNLRTSFSSSTTDTSPSSARSASATGSATLPSRSWQKTSDCLSHRLMDSRRKRSTSPAVRCLPRSRLCRWRGGSNRRSRTSSTSLKAASSHVQWGP